MVSRVGLADPAVLELMAMAGCDGACIDLEHTGFDLHLVGELRRVAELPSITPIVRVPANEAQRRRLLAMGTQDMPEEDRR